MVAAPQDGFEETFAGTFNVLRGTWYGLTGGGTLWHQGIGENEEGDRFGSALTTGDFDGDGHADLAVGAAEKRVGWSNGAGTVKVLYGGSAGLDGGSQIWSQDSESPDPVPGAAEWEDRFGHSLAAGDFDGDGVADLAAGVWLEDIGAVVSAGAVNVLYGSTGMREAP